MAKFNPDKLKKRPTADQGVDEVSGIPLGWGVDTPELPPSGWRDLNDQKRDEQSWRDQPVINPERPGGMPYWPEPPKKHK